MTDEARRRLKLVESHVQQPNTSSHISRERKSKPRRTELPADWSDVLSELDHVSEISIVDLFNQHALTNLKVRKLAQTPKTETTGYQRHKQAGKLWVRERIDLLLDRGTFREVGSAAGTATWIKPDGPKRTVIEEEKEVVSDFTPSNNVQGISSTANDGCRVTCVHSIALKLTIVPAFDG